MLKYRKRITVTIPIEQDEWLERQSEKEYLAKGRLVEKALGEYKERRCKPSSVEQP